VNALFYTSFSFPLLVHDQRAHLSKRPLLKHFVVFGAGLCTIYLFMLAVCVIAGKL
jgi:hypothetical protein